MASTHPIARAFKNVSDVASWRMCLGCGACAYACPEGKVKLVDYVHEGIRPVLPDGPCRSGQCFDCLAACPGIGVSHGQAVAAGGRPTRLAQSWGPVLEIWEGFAADPELRFNGSSAGMASALGVFCIERLGMSGAVHIGGDSKLPYKNRSMFSRTRTELLSATGSRYSPASPCDRLQAIEDAEGQCVFMGKPCDVEALRKVQSFRPRLKENLGVAISIFCAGTPSTQATLDLLRRRGVDPEDIEELRYRGRGWPGSFAVRLKGECAWKDLATYAEAWGFLQAYRPYRCYLCPDGTGELADISCGDPWYRHVEPGEAGTSLVVVRTEKGRDILRRAIAAGAVNLVRVDPETLSLSQRELELKRGAIWGRVVVMRTLALPAPVFRGFSLFSSWLRLPLKHKLRSIVGTARRALRRRYHSRLVYEHTETT